MSGMAFAQDAEEPPPLQTLFKNVKVFNGTDDQLYDVNVLVENNLIKEVGAGLKAHADATVIDGEGRTLMPGMADSSSLYDVSCNRCK